MIYELKSDLNKGEMLPKAWDKKKLWVTDRIRTLLVMLSKSLS